MEAKWFLLGEGVVRNYQEKGVQGVLANYDSSDGDFVRFINPTIEQVLDKSNGWYDYLEVTSVYDIRTMHRALNLKGNVKGFVVLTKPTSRGGRGFMEAIEGELIHLSKETTYQEQAVKEHVELMLGQHTTSVPELKVMSLSDFMDEFNNGDLGLGSLFMGYVYVNLY